MNLIVSTSPHVHGKATTQTIMRDVLIALVPSLIASVVWFGWRALLVTAVCVISCAFFEWGFEKLCKRPCTVWDLSACVTGVILAFNLPVAIPLWQAVFGSLVAIVVVKQLFGGIGKNFANPAITARVVMLLAFSGSMTNWAGGPDAVTSATPLARMAAGETVKLTDLLIGKTGGCLGETCVIALLIGFVYLLLRGVITWHTPVAMVATVAGLSYLLGADGLRQVMAGGILLGAVFMATDYTTTPTTPWGKILFGFGAGLLTVLIRQYGNYAGGVSFSILFMNILTPYLARWTASKPFGGVKA